MTTQIADLFRYKGKDYEIISVTAPINFNPCDCGFRPTSPGTHCYRGFYARFSAAYGKFRLNDLYIYCDNGQYPELFGVSGTKSPDNSFVHYKDMKHAFNFTGCLLIGRGFRKAFDMHSAFRRPGFWAYKDTVVLRFINGLLVNTAELSFFFQQEVNTKGPDLDLVKVDKLKSLLQEPLSLDAGEVPWFLKHEPWSMSWDIVEKLLVAVKISTPKRIAMMKQKPLSDLFLYKEYFEKVSRSPLSLKDVPEKFLTEEICLEAVREKGIAIEFVPKKFLTKELCKIAVATGWEDGAFAYVPKEYLTEEYLIELVENDYTWGDNNLLGEIPDDLKTHKLCFTAVSVNGNALEYVPEAFKTKELCLAAFDRTPLCLTYMPEEFITEEMCGIAVEQLGIMLEDVPDKFKTPELCQMAVEDDGLALKDVPERFMTQELCTMAVKDSGRNLQYVPERFMTQDLCELAVKNSGWSLEHVPERLKTKELCLLAYESDPDAVEFIPEEFKTEEMRHPNY